LRPIKAEFLTSLTHHPSVEDLVRASKGDLCLSTFSMHRDDDLAFAALFMLVSVKAAAVLGQPFPKCGAFHCFVPMYQGLDRVEPLRLSFAKLLCENSRMLSLICVKQLNDRAWPIWPRQSSASVSVIEV
jgi:hypothetical protein